MEWSSGRDLQRSCWVSVTTGWRSVRIRAGNMTWCPWKPYKWVNDGDNGDKWKWTYLRYVLKILLVGWKNVLILCPWSNLYDLWVYYGKGFLASSVKALYLYIVTISWINQVNWNNHTITYRKQNNLHIERKESIGELLFRHSTEWSIFHTITVIWVACV